MCVVLLHTHASNRTWGRSGLSAVTQTCSDIIEWAEIEVVKKWFANVAARVPGRPYAGCDDLGHARKSVEAQSELPHIAAVQQAWKCQRGVRECERNTGRVAERSSHASASMQHSIMIALAVCLPSRTTDRHTFEQQNAARPFVAQGTPHPRALTPHGCPRA